MRAAALAHDNKDTITTIKGISHCQFHPPANLEFSLLKRAWKFDGVLAAIVTRGMCHVAVFLISGCAVCFQARQVSRKWGWRVPFKVRSFR